MSYSRRQALGVAEPENEHFWGSVGKKEALADYVICSFLPPWGMIRHHEEELAIITLDAVSVCTKQGAAFCPDNSAFNAYPAEEIKTWQSTESFDQCFPNLDTYQAGNAEIFVPNQVPFSDFRQIVFCDAEAKEYWREQMVAAWNETNPKPTSPPQPLGLAAEKLPGFRFPENWAPNVRIR